MKYELRNTTTHKPFELDAISGTIGPDVLDISRLTRDLGVFTHDPGLMATVPTESKITYIDADPYSRALRRRSTTERISSFSRTQL